VANLNQNYVRKSVAISEEKEEISNSDQIEAYRRQYQEKLKAQIKLSMIAKSGEKLFHEARKESLSSTQKLV
jgi:hypothetical protein